MVRASLGPWLPSPRGRRPGAGILAQRLHVRPAAPAARENGSKFPVSFAAGASPGRADARLSQRRGTFAASPPSHERHHKGKPSPPVTGRQGRKSRLAIRALGATRAAEVKSGWPYRMTDPGNPRFHGRGVSRPLIAVATCVALRASGRVSQEPPPPPAPGAEPLEGVSVTGSRLAAPCEALHQSA
jgi:hypothetical protein